MINHFANQSQTCQLLRILKSFFHIEEKLWKVVKSRVELKLINYKFQARIVHVQIVTYIIY